MLQECRRSALSYVFDELEGGTPPDDLGAWFQQLPPERIYPYLAESAPKIEKVYTIGPDPSQEGAAILKVQNHKEGAEKRYPFIKQSPQLPYVGACFKRSIIDGKISPSPSRIQKTIKRWGEYKEADTPYSHLFDQFTQLAAYTQIRKEGDETPYTVPSHGCSNIIDLAIQHLIEDKKTAFLVVTDLDGNLPGDIPLYRQFIIENEPEFRYTTNDVRPHPDGYCALCGAAHVDVYAQGVKGAGINILNQDRASAFPGGRKDNAWKKYAICKPCCRLLHIYKDRVAPAFKNTIAGSSALVIPSLGTDIPGAQRFIRKIKDNYHALLFPNKANGNGGVARMEESLLKHISIEQAAVSHFTILWGNVGQDIDDIIAITPEVFPSRLNQISQINDEVTTWDHPCFPRLNDFRLQIDLGMTCLKYYFSQVADKSTKHHPDNSTAMRNLRRRILEAIYQRRPFQDPNLIYKELYVAMRNHYSLNYAHDLNFYSKDVWDKKDQPDSERALWVSICGWGKHVARLLYYLRHEKIGVLPMITDPYVPSVPELTQFVGPESGINTPAKAFAFWIGVLQAKVMMLQRNAGRNVAVHWLSSLQLHPDHLPRLFTKQMDKILSYDQERRKDRVMGWRSIRFPIEEISDLGIKLGDQIDLSVEQTNYFLLLGMGIANRVHWRSEDQKAETTSETETPDQEESLLQ